MEMNENSFAFDLFENFTCHDLLLFSQASDQVYPTGHGEQKHQPPQGGMRHEPRVWRE
jgi:hypothetical protein